MSKKYIKRGEQHAANLNFGSHNHGFEGDKKTVNTAVDKARGGDKKATKFLKKYDKWKRAADKDLYSDYDKVEKPTKFRKVKSSFHRGRAMSKRTKAVSHSKPYGGINDYHESRAEYIKWLLSEGGGQNVATTGSPEGTPALKEPSTTDGSTGSGNSGGGNPKWSKKPKKKHDNVGLRSFLPNVFDKCNPAYGGDDNPDCPKRDKKDKDD